jgi:hypothetical protein
MWGTDMPFQNRFCTYHQSRVWIEKYCAFLDRESPGKIMGARQPAFSDSEAGGPQILGGTSGLDVTRAATLGGTMLDC